MEMIKPSVAFVKSDDRQWKRWKLSSIGRVITRSANYIRFAADTATKAETDALTCIIARDPAETETQKAILDALCERMKTAQARRMQSNEDAIAAANTFYAAYHDALDLL